MMHYRIGQRVEIAPVRGVQGAASDVPRWFALVTRPQKEANARAWLSGQGVTAWYPSEQGWRRVPRGRTKRVAYERRVAPGYVFARFEGMPHWDRLLVDAPGSFYLRGAVGVAGRPLAIRDEVLACMAGLPAELAQLRRLHDEARRVRAGDRVEVLDGPLQGWVVDVAEVRGGMARLLLPLLGRDFAEVDLSRLRKVGVDG